MQLLALDPLDLGDTGTLVPLLRDADVQGLRERKLRREPKTIELVGSPVDKRRTAVRRRVQIAGGGNV